MKFVSWNVNGLRACIQKGFLEQFDRIDADFFCLQETKLSEGQLQLDLPGYEQYWCYAEKKGYSGTAIFTKHTPQSVHYGLDVPELDNEGRLITLEYPEFYLVTCYTPNAQRGLARIDHRMRWDEAFRSYLQKLDAVKPVILCGDLNVAHKEIDLKNPSSNRNNAGFSDQERDSFQKTLDLGFTDTFRHLHPDKTGAYSWWSYMFHARENNAGWRIDYFLVSDRLKDAIYRADIHSDVLGSDHCPVSVDLGLICNGGIWSPMQQGAARQILPESDEKPKDEKKASAVSAKALVAFAAVFAIFLSAILLWQEPPAADDPVIIEDPFTVHTFSTLPSYVLSLDEPWLSYLERNENALTDGDQTYYCPVGIDYGSLGNFCLRIDASYGYERRYGQAMTVTMEAVNPDAATVYSIMYREYYTSEKYTQFDGWLIFGTLNKTTTFLITVDTGDATFTHTVTVSPIRMDIPTIEDAFTVTTFEEPFYRLISASSDSSVSRIINESGSFGAYVEDLNLSRELHEWNSWFFAGLSPDAALALEGMELELNVTRINYSSDASEYLYHYPVYSDASCTQFIGWLIYGDLDPATDLHLSLFAGDQTENPIATTIVMSSPYLSRAKAEDMTTEELVRYLLSHRKFQKHLGYDSAEEILYGSDAYSLTKYPDLDFLRRTHPALDVLFDRPDAIATLMECSALDYIQKDIAYLLLEQYFYYYMTPRQQADFLTGNFSNCPYDIIDVGIPPIDTSAMTTAEVAELVLTVGDTCDLLSRCTSSEAQYLIFAYRKDAYSHLADLASRSDVLDVVTELYSSTDAWQYLSLIELFTYQQQRDLSKNMTTTELINAILADEALCEDILLYTDGLEIIVRNEPLIQSLLEREDAVDALMNDTPAEDIEKTVLSRILTWLFQDQMTTQQMAQFLTGLYPSSPEEFVYNGDYPLDRDTSFLVSYLDRYGEELYSLFDRVPKDSNYYDTCFEIYKLVVPYSDLLQTLETRDDTIAALRMFHIAAKYPASPVSTLLYLYEYYPIMDETLRTLSVLEVHDWSEVLSASGGIVYVGSNPYLYSERHYREPLSGATFAYFVTASQSILDAYPAESLALDTMICYPDNPIPASCVPCYTDVYCTNFAGWLVYGTTDVEVDVLLCLVVDGSEYHDLYVTASAPDPDQIELE